MKEKILIIEDEENVYDLLKYYLKREEYEILPSEFSDMKKAISEGNLYSYTNEIIKNNYNKGLRLLICDLNLFDSTVASGERLIESIRGNDFKIKQCEYFNSIVPIIAYSQHVDTKYHSVRKISYFVSKPIEITSLYLDKSELLFLSRKGTPKKEYNERENKQLERHKEKLIEHIDSLKNTIQSQIELFNIASKFIEEQTYPERLKNQKQKKKEEFKNSKTAFIISSFSDIHQEFINIIKDVLDNKGIKGITVDEQIYQDFILNEIETCCHAFDFGISIFSHIDNRGCEHFNANVSFEAGYMKALNKDILFLKEKGVRDLQSDLKGLPWFSFDKDKAYSSIKDAINSFLKQKSEKREQ